MICDECKMEKKLKLEIHNLKIKKCPHCGSIFLDKWMDPMDEKAIATMHIKNSFEVKDLDLSFSGDFYNRKVKYRGVFLKEGQLIEADGSFFIKVSLSSCPQCTLKRGNYYEAILQLRGGFKDDLDNALSLSHEIVNNAKSREIFITRTEKKREGYDLLLSDKQFARNMGKKLISDLGGVYSETSHLVGRKEGREIYRITVSIRLPFFHKGDLLKKKNEFYLVLKIKNNDVILYDLNEKNTVRKKLPELEDYQIMERRENIKEAILLYREGNTAYVLDPYDNKEKALIDKDAKEKLFVVKVEDQLIIVPIDLVS